MSEVAVEWIALLLFVALFVSVILFEIRWLTRKGWATAGRSTAFVLTTDLVSFGVGSFIAFVIAGVMLMMVFGPAGRGSDVSDIWYAFATVCAVILPILMFIAIKRLSLLIFKMRSGASAWLYSIVSSVAILAFIMIPPPALYFLIARLWK